MEEEMEEEKEEEMKAAIRKVTKQKADLPGLFKIIFSYTATSLA